MKSSTTEVFLTRTTRWALLGSVLGALGLTSACIANESPPAGTGSAPGSGGVAVGGGGPSSGGGSVGGASSGGSGGGAATGGASSGGHVATGGTIPLGGVPETVECMGDLPTEANADAPHKIAVQGSMSWGELPHFWNTFGVGRYGLYLQEDKEWGKILKEHTVDGAQNLGVKMLRMHGLFADDMGIYKGDDGNGKILEPDFTNADKIFDFFVENGIDSIVELAPMPSALASDPSKTVFEWKMGISPPKDYALWQQLVQAFAQHVTDKYGEEVVSRWYWEVWNEPECCKGKFWTGTLDDYFKLYDYSSAGVKAVLPNAKMGGPVSSQPVELTANSKAGILFLDHITKGTNFVPGGPKPELGFFAYHTWSFVGGAIDGYFQGLDLLDSYGLNNIPIAITEFGPTWQFQLENEPQEMTQGAAFVAQVYSDVSRRSAQEGRRFPIAHSWWVLSDVFDEEVWARGGEPFYGGMGLTSIEGIRKPAYNAYKFLAQMGTHQLAFNIEGPGDVGGMAARDDSGGIQIILYHGKDPGIGPNDMGPEPYYKLADPVDITISLEGLDADAAYNVAEYRIDETNGNAYGVWQDQGRPAMASMTEEQWKALRDNMDAKPTVLGEALCGSTFKRTISLGSPGVAFVTLTPAVK